MKEKKILFCDLDGTLLDDEKNVAQEVLDSVHALLAAGHFFVVCTGRPLASARAVARQFGLDGVGCYIIAYNGGTIYDPVRNKVLFHAAVPLPAIKELFAKADAAGLYIHTYGPDDTILTRCEAKELFAYIRHTKLPFETGEEVLSHVSHNPSKAIVASLDDHAALERFRAENAGWTMQYMTNIFSCEEYLEYCPKGISKGKAAERLCEQLCIPLARAVAVGDERNDLSMLRVAGIGAVPANAHPDVQNTADYRCKLDNCSGAVREVIETCLLGID